MRTGSAQVYNEHPVPGQAKHAGHHQEGGWGVVRWTEVTTNKCRGLVGPRIAPAGPCRYRAALWNPVQRFR